MGIAPLAVEERAAKLVLELLDGTSQSRLADVAPVGRTGEIELVGKRDEIADLLHLHAGSPSAPPYYSGATNLASFAVGRRVVPITSAHRHHSEARFHPAAPRP